MPLRNPQDFSLWHACRSWWKGGERKGKLNLLHLPLQPRTAARARCAVFVFILCHPTKNEPRKRTKGSNTPWHPARLFALAYLPLVVAKWRAMHFKILYFSPRLPLKSGNAKGGLGGNVRAPFFRHFLGRTKKWHKKRSASACRRHRVSVRLRSSPSVQLPNLPCVQTPPFPHSLRFS